MMYFQKESYFFISGIIDDESIAIYIFRIRLALMLVEDIRAFLRF